MAGLVLEGYRRDRSRTEVGWDQLTGARSRWLLVPVLPGASPASRGCQAGTYSPVPSGAPVARPGCDASPRPARPHRGRRCLATSTRHVVAAPECRAAWSPHRWRYGPVRPASRPTLAGRHPQPPGLRFASETDPPPAAASVRGGEAAPRRALGTHRDKRASRSSWAIVAMSERACRRPRSRTRSMVGMPSRWQEALHCGLSRV